MARTVTIELTPMMIPSAVRKLRKRLTRSARSATSRACSNVIRRSQGLARARHPAFRLACAIGGLKTIIKRLRRSGAELPGRQVRAEAAVDDLVWKHLLVDRFGDLV